VHGKLDDLGEQPLRPPFVVTGWALAPDAPVGIVELFIDGRPAGRARLGLHRPEVARRTRYVDAPICGFERIVLADEVPRGAEVVSVAAVAHDLSGRRFAVGEGNVRIARRAKPEGRVGGAAGVGERARGVARSPETKRLGETRVLAVTHSLRLGGAELWLQELLARLAARPGTAVSVVSRTDGPLRGPLERRGIPVYVAGDHPLGSPAAYEGRLAELAAWAAQRRFDIVLVNTIVAFPGVELADLLGIPSVFAVHESLDLEAFWVSDYVSGESHPLVRERAARAFGGATAVVFEAEATRRVHLRHGDPARFLTLPYGIELARIDRFRSSFEGAAERRRLDLPAGATVVLCLGKLQPRKGQAGLVQAFGELAPRRTDATLALVGESATSRHLPYAEAVRERVRRAGLSPGVRVVPLVDRPYEWLGVADLLVCPSDLESLPRVVLEAMAFDVPVLATEIFGLPDLIEDGATGWLCRPNDVGALAQALDRVLALGPERRAAVGLEGGRVVRARHDLDAYAERFFGLVDGLAADPGADPAALVS
jgi:D-inositol-3-phosphate glycosyltransferase